VRNITPSAPSIHWMPVITHACYYSIVDETLDACYYSAVDETSTELIFGFTLLTYPVGNNRPHIYL
jgi:hypothetical protein